MLSLGSTSYEMELGFSDLFSSYEMELGFSTIFTSHDMELETHGHVKIEKQLGFHEIKIAFYH